jgi:hypothetical protein
MSENRKDIIKELQELNASNLLQSKQQDAPSEMDESLPERALSNVYAVLAEEKRQEATTIDLRSAMKRQRAGSGRILLRMAAGIAALVIMTITGYRMLSGNNIQKVDCQSKDLLTCLSQQTSSEDIYNYLIHEQTGIDDAALYEHLESQYDTEYIPIDIQ